MLVCTNVKIFAKLFLSSKLFVLGICCVMYVHKLALFAMCVRYFRSIKESDIHLYRIYEVLSGLVFYTKEACE